jgi:alkanesulfonate monooxygenase SsuD/methylene tetrahydromethanopterin reductase-like flavin-dependent oxidoreductase (luciferase family)
VKVAFGLSLGAVLLQQGRVQTYVDGYVLYEHILGTGQNVKRMEELGLTEYALKRWALAGTPRDWIQRIAELAEAGATKLWVGVGGGDLDRQTHYMCLFGDQILPHFT